MLLFQIITGASIVWIHCLVHKGLVHPRISKTLKNKGERLREQIESWSYDEEEVKAKYANKIKEDTKKRANMRRREQKKMKRRMS